ncbi:MAG: hypothetical protein V3G41_10660 [Lachnospiraceae bacterium]
MTTLVCRKLFRQQLDVANMPEDVAKDAYEIDTYKRYYERRT